MLDFILKIGDQQNYNDIIVEVNKPYSPSSQSDNILKIFYSKENSYRKFQNDRYTAYVLGDLIIPKQDKNNTSLERIFDNPSVDKLRTLKGNFYILLLDDTEKSIICFNSLFSILPIYYYNADNRLIVSSSIQLIKKHCTQSFSVSKKYIVEKLLFNYAFLDETIYTNIKLLPSNHYLKKDKKLSFIKHTNIQDYFTDNPIEVKEALDPIADVFISNLKDYYPPEFFYLTLTGGFDSRTLAADALKNNLNFSTFSYGGSETQDLLIPKQLAEQLGFEHLQFILDESYAKTNYVSSLESLILNTDCTTSISRSHYAFIAEQLASKTNYFLSGNFGSDILRTTREAGVISSSFLLKLFEIDDKDLLYSVMLNNKALNIINKDAVQKEINEIFEDVINYKQSIVNVKDKNKQYYLYEFEEVYRKYFGPEFVIQNYYGLCNRAPFLDFDFVKELLKTRLAGINSRYMENNPLLRFKGQILYAKILQKLNSPLHFYPLDKGYKPNDFFSLTGKMNIARNYFVNRLKGKKRKNFSFYNEMCFNENKNYFKALKFYDDIFKKDKIENELANYSSKLNHVFAILLYLNKFN